MHAELVVAKVVTVLLGGLIAWQAYRGYRVHGSGPLLYVAVGFVFVSVGSVVEGVLFEVVGLSLFEAGAVQTTIVAVGMLFILYSLYGAGSLDEGGARGGPRAGDERHVRGRPAGDDGSDAGDRPDDDRSAAGGRRDDRRSADGPTGSGQGAE